MKKSIDFSKAITLYGVSNSLIRNIERLTKPSKGIYQHNQFIDCLIYMKELNPSIGSVMSRLDPFDCEDVCHSAIKIKVKVPNHVKTIFETKRLQQIERIISTAVGLTYSSVSKRRSAREFILMSEGLYYRISNKLAEEMKTRYYDLRQKQINKMPFNSAGFCFDIKAGESDYLKRVMSENDRTTVDGRKKILEAIDRIRSQRHLTNRFNKANSVFDGKNVPDIDQFIEKNRLYSIITSVPREYRSKMFFDLNGIKDNVVDVDIKASHTNFLPIVLKGILDTTENTSIKNNRYNIGRELIDYERMMRDIKNNNSDLYTRIANDRGITRDQVKEEWQLYTNNWKGTYRWKGKDGKRNQVYEWFLEKYKAINGMIEECHRIEKNNSDMDHDGNIGWRKNRVIWRHSISLQLHKAENGFIREVIRRYQNMVGGQPLNSSIISVHDSLMVPLSQLETLKESMEYVINHNSVYKSINYKIKRNCYYVYGCNIEILYDTQNKNEVEQLAGEVLPSVPQSKTTQSKTRNKKSYISYNNKQGFYVVSIKSKPYRSATIEGLYEKLRAAGINDQFEMKR